MYSAKFTLFYVIAALAALATASPVPVAAPEALAIRAANIDVIAREPLPVAEAVVAREPAPVESEEIDRRICRRSYACI